MLKEVNLVELSSNGRRMDCWYHEVCNADVDCNMCIRFDEMSYLMENSNLPKSKQRPINLNAPKCDIDAYKRLTEIKSNIVEFVENGNNLYINSSHFGNGKTSWAIKLLLKYFDEIWAGNGYNVRGIFVSVPMFLLKSKDFKNNDREFEELKKKILTADLVIWDDIASTNLSGYDYSQLLMYIDMRLLEEKSNIYTGNCEDAKTLEDKLGKKLTSRIFGNHTEVITFRGGDQR